MALSQKELIDALEPLVDGASTGDVLLALARVCNEKAEHIRDDWRGSGGEQALARRWDALAHRLDTIGCNTSL